jgi:hypothetical protein
MNVCDVMSPRDFRTLLNIIIVATAMLLQKAYYKYGFLLHNVS